MRTNRAIWCAVGGLMLALCLSGCVSDSDGGGGAETSAEAIVGQWTLVSIEGEPIDKLLAEGMRAPDLQVTEDGGVSGFAGVNRFSGKLDPGLAKGGGFSVGPLAATRMAGPPAAMELETRIFAALDKADRFTVTGDRLSLTRGDEVLMVYQKQD